MILLTHTFAGQAEYDKLYHVFCESAKDVMPQTHIHRIRTKIPDNVEVFHEDTRKYHHLLTAIAFLDTCDFVLN